MTREDIFRAMLDAINRQNEQALLECVQAGELGIDAAMDLAETMRTANEAKLRQSEARTDQMIDRFTARTDDRG